MSCPTPEVLVTATDVANARALISNPAALYQSHAADWPQLARVAWRVLVIDRDRSRRQAACMPRGVA
jgi:hypothetical protein